MSAITPSAGAGAAVFAVAARTAHPRGILTLGEAMGLLQSRQPGSFAYADDLRMTIAGAESNVAIGVARLGVPATWVSRVGTDPLGARILRTLRGEGVTVIAEEDPDAPTGMMIKESPHPPRTRVHYFRHGSAASRLSPADIAGLDLTAVGLVHVSGITSALSESAAEANRALVTAAREAGVLVSFDVNHRAKLWSSDDARAEYRWLAARAEVLFAGAEEAEILVGEQADEEALLRALAALGQAQTVLKLGQEGCIALIDGQLHRTAAMPVAAVDTVGAGDAFVAGYLAELLEDRDAVTRLGTAVRCGAIACLALGDWEGAPRRADLALLDAAAGDPVSR